VERNGGEEKKGTGQGDTTIFSASFIYLWGSLWAQPHFSTIIEEEMPPPALRGDMGIVVVGWA